MKKSKKYTGVYLNHKQNGDISYYITYRDENAKYRKIKVGDKSAGITEPYCKQKRDEILNKIRLGEVPPKIAKKKKKKITTFDMIASIYFDDRELHNRNNNREKQRYQKHIYNVFGNCDIDNITVNDIKKFQKDKAKKYAPKTVNLLLGLMSVIYNTAIEKDIFKEKNPIKQIKKLPVDNKRERFLSTDEINLLLNTVKDKELLYMFCLLALSTGARLESLLNIQKKDINFSTRTITIKDFKNNSTYKAFISKKLLPVLEIHLKSLNQNDYVINIDNKKLNIMNLRERLQPILNKLFNQGLKSNDSKNRVVVHTFRHTFASHLAINGTPIFTIQKLLNHKDIKATLRYAKLAPDSGQEMVDNLYI